MTRPNERLIRLSRQIESAAIQAAEALEHIRHELANCDSYPTQVPMAGPPTRFGLPPAYDEDDRCQRTAEDGMQCWNQRPCTDHDVQPQLSATERAANQRWELLASRAQIMDDIGALEQLVDSFNKVTTRAHGIRIPTTNKPRCWAGNLEGYELAHDDGGWSDPTCTGLPRRGDTGPCDRCYMRHIRYRARIGLPTLSSIQPARLMMPA